MARRVCAGPSGEPSRTNYACAGFTSGRLTHPSRGATARRARQTGLAKQPNWVRRGRLSRRPKRWRPKRTGADSCGYARSGRAGRPRHADALPPSGAASHPSGPQRHRRPAQGQRGRDVPRLARRLPPPAGKRLRRRPLNQHPAPGQHRSRTVSGRVRSARVWQQAPTLSAQPDGRIPLRRYRHCTKVAAIISSGETRLSRADSHLVLTAASPPRGAKEKRIVGHQTATARHKAEGVLVEQSRATLARQVGARSPIRETTAGVGGARGHRRSYLALGLLTWGSTVVISAWRVSARRRSGFSSAHFSVQPAEHDDSVEGEEGSAGRATRGSN